VLEQEQLKQRLGFKQRGDRWVCARCELEWGDLEWDGIGGPLQEPEGYDQGSCDCGVRSMALAQASADAQHLPEARVQLWDEDGNDQEILYGVWEEMPWGMNDFCYAVILESGQQLQIWLEGVTERDSPSRPKETRKLVLQAKDRKAEVAS
jgi:hypothetical protein